jgi:hypothetical protein
MITNVGKNLLAKYLIGQAPSYASHIALGCGATPNSKDHQPTSQEVAKISEKENLDFEMFRVPITSRGYVSENGQSKIVLTAELPTVERYEITEIGVYSSSSNPTAGAYDSKTVYSFSTTENWEYHTQTTVRKIPTIEGPLATGTEVGDEVVISQTSPVFQTNADNETLLDINRLNRYESCRYLNNTIFIAGNDATLSIPSGERMVASSTSNHIHLLGASIDFNQNSPDDELRLAFSIVNKSATQAANQIHPTRVKILIEFADNDAGAVTNYAQFQVDETSGVGETQDFSENRYFVITKTLEELIKSTTFSWNAVNVIKIWASVLDEAGEPSPDYYVALDALRLENTETINPLYGMTGYSVVRSSDMLPIVKVSNTASLVEFRFAIDVELDI